MSTVRISPLWRKIEAQVQAPRVAPIRLLPPPPPPPPPEPPPVDAPKLVAVSTASRRYITWVTAQAFGADLGAIYSTKRMKIIVRPRQTAMFLCKRIRGDSLTAIGNHFAGRDHATALYATRKVERIAQEHGIDCGEDPQAWAQALAALPAKAWRGA